MVLKWQYKKNTHTHTHEITEGHKLLQQPYLLIGIVPLVRFRWLVITLGIGRKIFEKCPLYAI